MISYWDRSTFLQESDYLIVGGGLVGMWTAWYLKKADPGARITILERGAIPAGASTRNAGFCCFGSVSEIQEDFGRMTHPEVFELVEKRYRGLQLLREILGDQHISYEGLGGFEIFRAATEFESCKQMMAGLNAELRRITGGETYKVNPGKAAASGFHGIAGVIENSFEGQVHTGKMAERLMQICREKDIRFMYGCEVEDWADAGDSVNLQVKSLGVLRAGRVLFATNGFSSRFFPHLDVRPARAQVLVTKPVQGLLLNGSFHYENGYYYFRNIDNRILLGGGRNLDPQGESTLEENLTPRIQQALEELLYNVICPYAKPEIDMRWSGTMGVGAAKYPIIEKVSKNTWCAVRLGGMGVALGTVVGEETAGRMRR